ncbi:hypothetical protein ACFTZI_20855 [Streptomyces decoyicus]|uniref:hypothetical protein n=1 Tax=Streptomyces decoyicus TaxID=249567 RepID=UPI00363B4AC6
MPDALVRTAHQAANDVRQRLDEALRRAGVSTESAVAHGLVEGIKTTRVRFAALTLEQSQRLTQTLGGPVTRSADPLASVVRLELDEALRLAGVTAQRSEVIVGTVNGKTAHKISMSPFTLLCAKQLAKILESGQ